MILITKNGRHKIVCDSAEDFIAIRKEYFSHIPESEWILKEENRGTFNESTNKHKT